MTRIRTAAAVDPTDRFTQQIRSLQEQIAELQRRGIQSDTFTPTLTSLVMGTGGSPSNTAAYTYAGGILIASGRMVYGTTGRTFPSSASRIALPAGFTCVVIDAIDHIVGQVVYRDSDVGAAFRGSISLASTTTVRPLAEGVAGNDPQLASPTSTTPFTWASGDSLTWQYVVRAVRS